MSKPISITDKCDDLLFKECRKDEMKIREEPYSIQIMRILRENEEQKNTIKQLREQIKRSEAK